MQNKLDSYDKSVYKTEQERIDELVADSMFDVFTNEKTVQEFVKQDRNAAQRVLDRIKTLIADIRNIYNKLIAQGSDEIAALRDELETLEKIRDLFFEALDETAPAVSQKQKNTAEAVSGEVKYSYKGKSEDGRSIYKTNYKKGTPKATKQQDLINLVQNVWSKKPIKLTVIKNGTPHNIVAKFNPELTERSDLSKMAFGNRKGTASDQRITLDLASDFYQIAEESKYVKSKKESGKDYNPAHHGVTNWEYFVTNLIYEDENGNHIDCFMNIDVKEKYDGHYFYSFAIEKGTAPQTLLAVVTEDSATVPINSISEKVNDVNKNVDDVKFSTKPKPNLDPDGVRTPGKRLVESDLTKEGGLNYNFEEHDPLSFDDRAMPNSKSSINWVYKAEIFSNVENKMFHQKLAEIRQGSEAFVQTEDGEYIIPIENKLVFTNGDFNRPYVREIIEVITGYSTNFEKVKDVIVDEARGRTGHREAMQLVKQVFGDGLVLQYKSDINGAYGWADRKPKGRNRRAAINNYINQQIRKRNASKSSTNQSVIPSTKPNNPRREEVSDYINNRSDMQAIYKTIDKRYRIAGKTRLNEKSIESFANKILSQTHSKYSKELLTERLTALFLL